MNFLANPTKKKINTLSFNYNLICSVLNSILSEKSFLEINLNPFFLIFLSYFLSQLTQRSIEWTVFFSAIWKIITCIRDWDRFFGCALLLHFGNKKIKKKQNIWELYEKHLWVLWKKLWNCDEEMAGKGAATYNDWKF